MLLYRLSFPFLLGVYLGVGWLGHRVPVLKVWGTAAFLPEWLHHFTFLPSEHKGSNFSVSSSVLNCLSFGAQPS